MTRLMQGGASLWVGSAVMVSCLASFASSWGPSEAQANQAASAARLQASITALEARVAALAPLEKRVAALEARLRQHESTDAPQPTGQPKPLLVSLSGQTSEPKPMLVGTEKTALFEQEEPVANWNGLYWGASFGAGSGRSKSKFTTVNQNTFLDTTTRSSQDLGEDGSTFLQTETFSSSFYERITGRGVADWNEGALADLYLGANAHLTRRIIVGAQVEGGLSQMVFQSNIQKARRTSRQSSKSFSAGSSDGDKFEFGNTSSSSSQSVENLKGVDNELELDWTVSVIGRAGYLATPTTLLYGLAGWTYGHFEVEDTWFAGSQIDDFGSHGVTVGGGFEQRLSEKWSLRGEYRYTDFGKENFSKKVSSNRPGSGAGSDSSRDRSECCDGEVFSSRSVGSSTSTTKDTFSQGYSGYFDNDMHVGRIGVTRYFSLWE